MEIFDKPVSLGKAIGLNAITMILCLIVFMYGRMQDAKVTLEVQQAQSEAFDALSDRVKLLEDQLAQSMQAQIEANNEQAAAIEAETLKPTVFDSANNEPVTYFGPVGAGGPAGISFAQ